MFVSYPQNVCPFPGHMQFFNIHLVFYWNFYSQSAQTFSVGGSINTFRSFCVFAICEMMDGVKKPERTIFDYSHVFLIYFVAEYHKALLKE
jgi:hypothetical protein